MSELLLPLPSSVFRQVSTDWAFWAVDLPYRQAFIRNHVLVNAVDVAMVCLATVIVMAVMPDPSLSQLLLVYVVVVPILIQICELLLSANLVVIVHQEFLMVFKWRRFLTSHIKSIGIRACAEVRFVHSDGKQQIQVSTENGDLRFGEQLTLEEQNCLMAEIKEAYFSWGKAPSLAISS
jgi:hypothetical protein